MKFDHTMQAIGEGVFPMTNPHEAKVIFINISHAMYPNNLHVSLKAQDAMTEAFNRKQLKSKLPLIQT